MKLNLSLPVTISDVSSVLAAVYAFAPTYQFSYNPTTSSLETVIDASQDLSSAQLAIVNSAKYSISFVLTPPVVAPVVPQTSTPVMTAPVTTPIATA